MMSVPEPEDLPIKPKRILLVEDDTISARLLRHSLEARGHTVTSVESVTDAIRAGSLDRYDVLLCDLSLPDGDGLDVVRALSSQPWLKAGAVTGRTSEKDVREGKEAGCQFHLSKPVDVDVLVGILDSL